MKYVSIVILLVSLSFVACESKKKVIETSQETQLARGETNSFSSYGFTDSLLEHLTFSIDKLIYTTSYYGANGSDSIVYDSARFVVIGNSPSQRKLVVEGVRLNKDKAEQKTASAQQSLHNDSTKLTQKEHSSKTEKTKPSYDLFIFCIVLLLIVGIELFLYFGVYKRLTK